MSEDAGATFTAWPVEQDPDLSLSSLAADDGLAVTAGYWYGSGDHEGAVQLSTASHHALHRIAGYEGTVGIAFGTDRVLVGLMGPSVATPD